ncbi:hypothetical protein IG631_23596 [Alternaria alternata]|nr:hypothetical protein IG631_23596 [Alternaria alternata]
MQRVVELLKQTVPMHISEEKLLREVKKAQEELERKQEDLKRGQEELKRGQEELKRGQEASMRVQGQMSETMSDILAIGKKTAHRSDYASFRGSRSRLEYAPHSEPALPDQRRTIHLRGPLIFNHQARRAVGDNEPSAIPISKPITELLSVAVIGYCTALRRVVWCFRCGFP